MDNFPHKKVVEEPLISDPLVDPLVAALFYGACWHIVAAAIRGHGLARDARRQGVRVMDLNGGWCSPLSAARAIVVSK